VLFKEQPLPSGSFSEKKVHFQAADIAAIKNCSLRGIEGPTALFVLRYPGTNDHGLAETMIIITFFTRGHSIS
jgi:hypothetical protein